MAGPITGTPKKEECFFCGTESENGDWVQVLPHLEYKNKGVTLARWACNKCIAEYKRYLENE